MIQIDDKLISDNVVEKHFLCDVDLCQGECCVAGEMGAPLDEEELLILESIYEKVQPFLSAEGGKAIQEQGHWVIDTDGDYSTPMIENGGPCAYTIFENGVAKCGIEKAYYAGAFDWKKPISCHLYPIRVERQKYHEVLNYHEWDICKSACKNGLQKGVYIFEMVKEALIRKYGADFYQKLEATAHHLKQENNPDTLI